MLLDEKDAIWTELRGKHVAEVSQVLSGRIREIMNSSTANVLSNKEGGNLYRKIGSLSEPELLYLHHVIPRHILLWRNINGKKYTN